MKICVFGLWHLGTVTAACLARGGHDVIGLDFDIGIVESLRQARPPVLEPGLSDLVREGVAKESLRFSDDPAEALRDAEVLWVAYDTPVDDEDEADVGYVVSRVESLFEHLRDGTLVIISSQLPVGTTARLEKSWRERGRTERVSFVYSPENLRLGKAIEVFTNPDRIVAGTRTEEDRQRFAAVMAPFTSSVEWMRVESAEMTKHALNAFLATSVAFANEIAVVCEETGADAKEVERGLKSDARIGQRAYLSPGAAFAGGTLARDVAFLNDIATRHDRSLPLIEGVRRSNDRHRSWAREKIRTVMPTLSGRRIAVWGLTYKAGTDTLRRSAAVELCRWLIEQGAAVAAHDPAIRALPEELRAIRLCNSPQEALSEAEALVIATDWPEYRAIGPSIFGERPVMVFDPNRVLAQAVTDLPSVRYFTVGRGTA